MHMTQIELEAYYAIKSMNRGIETIADQLKIVNRLKALELKAKHPELTDIVDKIVG